MRTIEVDDEVFVSLELASKLTKLSIPQLVRQSIESLDSKVPAGGRGSTAPQKPQTQLDIRDKALSDYVKSPGFLANRSVVDQFLGILSFLHKQNPGKFATLQSLEGRKAAIHRQQRTGIGELGDQRESEENPKHEFLGCHEQRYEQ